jgi:hypothetical protein
VQVPPATMRSPMIVCRRMNAHSSASRGPGLDEDRVRDADLADVMQLGRVVQPSQLVLGHAQLACHKLGHP